MKVREKIVSEAGHRTGTCRYDFRKSWISTCKDASLIGMLRHDCRWSEVCNMVNLGIPERVAMSVAGHKTRSMFDRYHIVSPSDLQEAARKLAGTISDTAPPPPLTHITNILQTLVAPVAQSDRAVVS